MGIVTDSRQVPGSRQQTAKASGTAASTSTDVVVDARRPRWLDPSIDHIGKTQADELHESSRAGQRPRSMAPHYIPTLLRKHPRA